MPKLTHFLVAVIAVAMVGIDVSSADAQNLRSRQPLQFGFRWLGQGWSAGYHHQNPGPNTDYYNPYTAHNSHLISRMPGHQMGHYQHGSHSVVPNSQYSNYSNQDYAQSIQPTFVPVNDEDEDAEDDDNDFRADDDMPEVTSDPDEPGSIRVDEDSEEDADFDESSFDDDGAFDESDAESTFEGSGSSTKATKTGFSAPAPGSFEALDFSSYMAN